MWLGWQIVRELLAERLPPAMALRISPSSADVLGRAAESEFAAGNVANAEELARLSLSKAPFNVRAVRVLGLATAERGDSQRANDLITLAGNWSLRDDPSHAWLVQQRLSAGNYASSFAHADTLARRRMDLQPRLFKFFEIAAVEDPRSIPALVAILRANPPWRYHFLAGLNTTLRGQQAAANLVLAMNKGPDRITDTELGALYYSLRVSGRIEAIRAIRRRVGRPAPDALMINGDFSDGSELIPFAWTMESAPGISAEIFPDDVRENQTALRAQYDGYGTSLFAQQFLLLDPGRYNFAGLARVEAGKAAGRLAWTVTCVEDGAVIAESRLTTIDGAEATPWTNFSSAFQVPGSGCSAQWLRLAPRAADRRSTIVVWYDRLSITRAGAPEE